MSQSEQRALVLGGGTMGVGIVAMFLAGGWKVDVVSRSASTREGLPAATARALQAMGKPGDTSGLSTHATLANAHWPAIAIAVETVTEDLPLKQKLFAEMEALAQPDCALTSNSSSFPISRIGQGLKTQSRMMGLHFFMPAHLIPLVEVVRSVNTDSALAEKVGGIMSALGKRPVQVKKDVIGFLGNRIQAALMREALWLIEQGVASPADVDATVRLSFGFRYAAAGPIVQKEHSGWDTTCAVAKVIYPDLCNADGPPPVLQRNVDEGRIGFKTRRGFFDWDDESIAKERARYERALRKCLEIFREEGIV
ncbi:3-hydroxyacyl-CoA dehydrogenase NAD-binding domain-containing protein [Enhydrobacter sp.]|uniref:3-hydroxyacyl-CoA dehydrogenase family protein n=1 Tax=Enhydrobacter sp. TaxID=1894999 RepID=UPI00263148F9|nr:3-hydroxyacyl-CoA dehydrogenase NAD-binding domain-containing protein [Enhydrobacter sp.]WIM12096.1 MAG: 3-hydroxybutyryl-CoA dehydrogenase [Enhydrobacter sp.]